MQNRLPISNALGTPNFRIHIKEDRLDLELNLIEDISEQQSIAMLAEELDSVLGTGRMNRVVIDLRNNLGGNNQLYAPIIQCLQKHKRLNTKDNLFVFMSRNTFSAGINLLDDLNFYTQATLIGEPAGAGATHYGDAAFLQLPHSGIFFFLSTRQWLANDSSRQAPMIQADLEVSYSFEAYMDLVDPWEKAIEGIGQSGSNVQRNKNN